MRSTAEDTISIETVINAPIENVWNAWTEASTILKWFGSDPNGKGLKAEMDVRPGGHFEITFANADGSEYTCFGIYRKVKKSSELSFTWEWKNEPGVESFVTVKLTPIDHSTKMQFEHSNVGAASSHSYLAGWQETFEKLKRILK
jgi:uncharacterized protein YndB with AHSA1/START domain